MKKSKSSKKAKKPASKQVKKVGSAKDNSLGRPYGDRVLVKPVVPEETTSFGLVLPDSGKEEPERGVVVSVGEGKQTNDGKIIPVRVKVGDQIMFSRYSQDKLKINGEEYFLIPESSITYVF